MVQFNTRGCSRGRRLHLGRDRHGVSPGLLCQGDDLTEHQVPCRPGELVDVGGRQALGRDGIED